MGIFDRANQLRGTWPVSGMELWARAGIESFLGNMVGVSLDEEEINRRQREQPRLDAELGASEVLEGIFEDDPQKGNIGAARIINALSRADEAVDDSPASQKLADDVRETARNVLPLKWDIAEVPYITPPAAQKMARELGQTDGTM